MFRELLNKKIGQLLSFLANEVKPLSLNKTFKLLYLIDEIFVNETGVPVTWLEYKASKEGPLVPEIYDELNGEKDSINSQKKMLDNYIRVEKDKSPGNSNGVDFYIYSKLERDLSEFTEHEIELISLVVEKYGKLPEEDLISILQERKTLWYTLIQDQSLQENQPNHTITIDFTVLNKDDQLKQFVYESSFDSLKFNSEVNKA